MRFITSALRSADQPDSRSRANRANRADRASRRQARRTTALGDLNLETELVRNYFSWAGTH